ncbi:Uncharacterised protein [Mycobacteroides abscessus subsp. abscessus]|nr:Uncharacterised protein [Mycobacteroides abscessus subsp. abscessus]
MWFSDGDHRLMLGLKQSKQRKHFGKNNIPLL